MSTARTESSGSETPIASSNRCRYFAARLPAPLASRTQPLRESRSSAALIVGSSYATTGSRFVVWLQASRSALSDSGYASGVVRCFSMRQPSTRNSTASASIRRTVPAAPQPLSGTIAP